MNKHITSDMICQKLSDYLGKKVVYNVIRKTFKDFNDHYTWTCLTDYQNKQLKILIPLPPELVLIISKFYVGDDN